MAQQIQTLKFLYEQTQTEALNEFIHFLKFQSVSSEKNHKEDILACADWVKGYLEKLGFDTELWETSGYPVIFASYLETPEAPTLLIYNHYDVQPVDPLELWKSPPFDPTIRNGEVYARGAQDNKGQCFYVLQALKLLLQRDKKLPLNIKLVIEGEEETGSAGLSEILKKKQKELTADYLAIVDLGIPSLDKPGISLGCRGIITMDVELVGSSTDLHSGSHGGIVYNPIHALVEILSKLRDSSGKLTIPGFYDDVIPMTDKEKAQLDLEFDPKEYRQMFEAEAIGGEKGLTPFERAWMRPTLEINGIFGGYTGTGFKTVIPAKAHAKISCRLVPNQEPYKIAELVKKHIESLVPKGLSIDVDIHPGVGGPVRSMMSSKAVQAFSQAYQEIFEKKIVYNFEGASIPIINELASASHASVVLVGLGLPDDQIHAPNEHFGVDRLKKGALIMARAMELLA